MMELIQYRAIQSEKELAMYVVEATAAAELQAKLLEEARAREAKEREGRRRKENLLNGGTGASDDLNSSINIDLTNITPNTNVTDPDDGIEVLTNSESPKNIFKPIGTLLPIMSSIAKENAISVAVGIAQPTKFCSKS